jgi:hypothetical protein
MNCQNYVARNYISELPPELFFPRTIEKKIPLSCEDIVIIEKSSRKIFYKIQNIEAVQQIGYHEGSLYVLSRSSNKFKLMKFN